MSQRTNLFLLSSILIACGGVADDGGEPDVADERGPTRETAGMPVDPTGGTTGTTSGGCGSAGAAPVSQHSVCQVGVALRACSTCVSTICAADPYCCAQSWDVLCVKAARLQPTCGCGTSGGTGGGGSAGKGGSTL